MATTMLAVTLVMVVLLVAVTFFTARRFRWRPVSIHSDPDVDPLLARREDREGPKWFQRPGRFVAGVLLLALAITTFLVTLTVDFGAGAYWAVLGVGLLYAAVVLFETSGFRRAGPN
ncbi:MAG: hypothetical protein V5A43_03840 [Haloarculaceae archaeon]